MLGGGGALKGFLEYLEMVSAGAAMGDIQELRGLVIRKSIDRKLGHMGDRLLTQLIYRVNKCPNPKLNSNE